MTKKRILQFIDYKGIKISTFLVETGIKRGFLDKDKLNGTVSDENFAKIVATYPDINIDWLITGSGEMLRNHQNQNIHNQTHMHSNNLQNSQQIAENQRKDTKNISNSIPLIPISAMAGMFEGDISVLEYECERFVIPTFRDAEFLISVRGSSMIPKYNSGDIVACKCIPIDTFFQWNKVYVLDTEQGALIKRIQQSDEPDMIKIVSDNPNYQPFELHKSKIYCIALVIGVIRLES